MHLTDKEREELRKLLNKAWDKCRWRAIYQSWVIGPWRIARGARYRDVSKIIKEAKEKKDE